MTPTRPHDHGSSLWRSQRHFHGTNAIVTDGASGIGRVLGAALVSFGAPVVPADIDGAARAKQTTQIGWRVAPESHPECRYGALRARRSRC